MGPNVFSQENERFKTQYSIDKKTHPDSEIVRICGKDMPLGKVRSVYDQFNETKYRMISFYDDMFQYTSLGLVDILFDEHKITAPIPIRSFFARKSIYGKQWVYEIASRFNISKEEVDRVEKERYEDIILRSPRTCNIESFFKLRPILDSQLLIFKYPFKRLDAYLKRIRDVYDQGNYSSLEVDFTNGRTEQEYYDAIPKVRLSYYDIIICQDAASLIEFTEKKEINDCIIMTDFDHCGIRQEAKYVYEVITEGVGPRNSRIYYVKEGF